MARICETEFQLFADLLALLLGLFDFLTQAQDDIACNARKHLQAKSREAGSLFIDLHSSLDNLSFALEGVDAHSSFDQIRGLGAINGLFGIFQELYRGTSADSDSENESKPETPIETAQGFVDKLKDPKSDSAAINGRLASVELTLWRAKYRTVKALRASILECLTVFQKPEDYLPEKKQESKTLEEWERPLETNMFTNAKDFHRKLRSTWTCACSSDRIHQNSFFSFYPPKQDSGRTMGEIYFPTRESNLHGWKHTSYEYQRQQASVQMFGFPASHAEQGDCEETQPEQFCSALNCVTADDSVRIVSGLNVRRKRRSNEQVSMAQIVKKLPLSPCSELPPEHSVFGMSFKFRMTLGLYLSYAFMHLSGGCWWPYTIPSTVMIPDRTEEDTQPMVFFKASLLRAGGKQTPDGRSKQETKPFDGFSFARFLIELWLAKRIDEGEIETILAKYANTAFYKEMVLVTSTCIALESFTGEERMVKEKEHQIFQGVILPLQRVMWYAHQTTALDIFALPPATMPSGEYTMEHPAPQQPWNTVSTSDTRPIVGEYCLRDGKDQPELLKDESAQEADDYMNRLDDCFVSVFAKLEKLSPEINLVDSPEPVKVAILDTGVQIPNHRLNHVFEGRLMECRTWLKTSASDGEELPPGGHDADGHGTHGASVLLQATVNTDIYVYVAQVFSARNEKAVRKADENDIVVARIVNALHHAIEVWKVDVISMSFGFTDPVPSIYDVLEQAKRRGVILLAAASNYGASSQVSWPAREDGVLAIYASTGLGNKYPGNPAPIPNSDNFAVLGTAVQASWPGTEALLRKSGTSTAAPLCAAIVAFVISVMRCGERKWISAYGRLYPDDIEGKRRLYKTKLEAMKRQRQIARVLKLMVGGERDGYLCITPWTLFDEDRDAYTIISDICKAIDAK